MFLTAKADLQRRLLVPPAATSTMGDPRAQMGVDERTKQQQTCASGELQCSHGERPSVIQRLLRVRRLDIIHYPFVVSALEMLFLTFQR